MWRLSAEAFTGRSSNGRTSGSGPDNPGSSPGLPVNVLAKAEPW